MTRTTRRMVGVGITLVATVGLAVAASGVTSAYFSDTKSGTITGTVGQVKILTSGGSGPDGLNLAFSNLMPGEPQTVTIAYTSLGTGPQDLFFTFPDVASLHALNNMGTFGEVTITDSSTGQVFHSTNLNDDRPDATGTCGPFSEAGCWPLPSTLKFRSGLPAGASGTVSFTFSYPGKKKSGQGLPWNPYPAPGSLPSDSLTTGAGLPFRVVATQVGQQP